MLVEKRQRGMDGLYPASVPHITSKQRDILLERDNYQCQAKVMEIPHGCTQGIVPLEGDHINPRGHSDQVQHVPAHRINHFHNLIMVCSGFHRGESVEQAEGRRDRAEAKRRKNGR